VIISSRLLRSSGTAIACITLFGALLTTAAVAGPPQKSAGKPKPPVKGDIVNGKKVYSANSCVNCHVINGEGGSGGPELTTIGLNPKHTPAWFKKAIVTPKAVHPDSTMPPYDSIKEKDLTDLIAYLGSLKKKAAP